MLALVLVAVLVAVPPTKELDKTHPVTVERDAYTVTLAPKPIPAPEPIPVPEVAPIPTPEPIPVPEEATIAPIPEPDPWGCPEGYAMAEDMTCVPASFWD